MLTKKINPANVAYTWSPALTPTEREDLESPLISVIQITIDMGDHQLKFTEVDFENWAMGNADTLPRSPVTLQLLVGCLCQSLMPYVGELDRRNRELRIAEIKKAGWDAMSNWRDAIIAQGLPDPTDEDAPQSELSLQFKQLMSSLEEKHYFFTAPKPPAEDPSAL